MSTSLAHSLLPDAIHDELRAGILARVDPPGTTYTESAVALRFGVSRPTAKMAIERLVAEGLLRRDSHSAARIPELSRDDIVDLFENRAIVESAALGRARRQRNDPGRSARRPPRPAGRCAARRAVRGPRHRLPPRAGHRPVQPAARSACTRS